MTEVSQARVARIERPRHAAGWRAGRPIEDPNKTKRWGVVSAMPSEYLVHVRGGAVTGKSGQGASCFKWPWESVAIVPTSLQRLQFSADQVSAENVGVEVVGLAVYRIADPELAFRLLNFSFPERAQEKLEDTLTAMFVGATRRLVASLTVDECLRKRKSALSNELIREIAPVLAGRGHPGDHTDRGWGLVIDTIEIQEVRVLSERVFEAMQAPYRADIDRQAAQARALADKAIEEAEIRAQSELQAQRGAAERQAAEARTAQQIRLAELAAVEAEAAIAAHALRLKAQQNAAELDRASKTIDAELRRVIAEVSLEEGRAESEVALAHARAQSERAHAEARVLIARNMPALAAAIGERIGEVRIAHYGADGNPFTQLTGALTALLETAGIGDRG